MNFVCKAAENSDAGQHWPARLFGNLRDSYGQWVTRDEAKRGSFFHNIIYSDYDAFHEFFFVANQGAFELIRGKVIAVE